MPNLLSKEMFETKSSVYNNNNNNETKNNLNDMTFCRRIYQVIPFDININY